MNKEVKKAIATAIVGIFLSFFLLMISTYFSTFAKMTDVGKINVRMTRLETKIDFIIKELNTIKRYQNGSI